MQNVVIPSIVVGGDVETKSLRPDAYILSIGLAAFDIATLRLIGASYQAIDPNDAEANRVFHTDPSTIGWWEGKDNPDYAPSEAARKEAFSGTTNIKDALWTAKKFLDDLGNKPLVLTMRGPDFDSPILMNAFAQCDVPPGKFRKFSMLDSDRTAERLAHAFGLLPDMEAEAHNWTRGKDFIEHHAGFDAAKEGYLTARIYHLALIARTHGFPRMQEAHEQMRTGEYIPTMFLRED